MKLLNLFICIILSAYFKSSTVYCQPYVIDWEKSFGGINNEYSFSIVQDIKNEYAVVGRLDDTSLCSLHGVTDMWFVKLDSAGNQIFSKCLGGSQYETVSDIKELSGDSGFIICGSSGSNDFDVVGIHGTQPDFWILKTDLSGNIIWSKCYGGFNSDGAAEIEQTDDKGFIIAGTTSSNDGNVFGYHGGPTDAWVIKIDSMGSLEWQKCFGGSDNDWASSIIKTFDKGYIFAGVTFSNDGDVTNNHGLNDAWIVKIDSLGDIQWQKTYGGGGYDNATSIIQNADSGYIFSAITSSLSGDVTHFLGSGDVWVVKINSNGNIIRQNSYGGSSMDVGYKIINSSDGSFYIGGNSNSNDSNISNHHGSTLTSDYWIFKIDIFGNLINEQSFGGTDEDHLTCIRQTRDSGIVLTGYTLSSDGEVGGNLGGEDFWIVKLSGLQNSNKEVPDQLTDISAKIQDSQISIRFVSPKGQSVGCNLYDINGLLLAKSSDTVSLGINSLQFNTGRLNRGFYFLEIITRDFKHILKLIY